MLPDFDIQLKIIYSSAAGQGLAANRTVCYLTENRQAVSRRKCRLCKVGLRDCNISDVVDVMYSEVYDISFGFCLKMI